MNLLAPRKLLLSILSLSCLFNLATQESHASLKRRVAIMPFTYGAVSSELGTTDVGKGITTLLITKMVNDGTYSVVDREMLDSILKEQNLSVSDRADPATACKIGKILSVDAIIVGTVTQFGFETKSANVGGLAGIGTSYIPVVGGLGSFGLGSVGVKKSKARVAVDARIIDINTTEILGAVHGAGESKRTGTALFAGVGPEWGSDDFAGTIAGEATLQAVDAIGSQLIALSAKIPDNQSIAAANVSGKVADVTGNQVIVNIGKSNGLAVGDNLRIDRPYKTIKDPVTGKVLKELNKTIAVVTISELDSATATGDITKGSGVQVGDSVSKATMSVSAVIVEAPPAESGSKVATSSQTTKKTTK